MCGFEGFVARELLYEGTCPTHNLGNREFFYHARKKKRILSFGNSSKRIRTFSFFGSRKKDLTVDVAARLPRSCPPDAAATDQQATRPRQAARVASPPRSHARAPRLSVHARRPKVRAALSCDQSYLLRRYGHASRRSTPAFVRLRIPPSPLKQHHQNDPVASARGVRRGRILLAVVVSA